MNYVESFNLLGIEAKQIPCIRGEGAPTTATEGAVGCFYMDTSAGTLYKCTAVESENYIWAKFEGEKGDAGTDGVIFTPHVSADGTLSWTNDGGLTNPDPVNIVANAEGIGEIVQNTGDSETAIMSQKAVSDELNKISPPIDGLEAIDTLALFVDTNSYYDKTMKKFDYNYTGQITIPVVEGEVYYLSSYAYYGMVRYILVDDANTIYGYAPESDAAYYENTEIVVPEGATTLIVQSRTTQRKNIVFQKKVLKRVPAVTDKLNGKTIIFAGDSICHDSPHDSAGWAARIGDAHEMVYKNYGIDGSTIATGLTISGVLKNSIVGDTLPQMISEYPNADYIIFEGGTNDADLIGSILDGATPDKYGEIKVGYAESNFDTTTFCGAVEMLLRKAIVQWKGKKIGFIIAHKMGGSNTGHSKENFNRRAYFETIIKCCEKWGVPYINLWDTCHLNPNMTEMYNPDVTADENENGGMLYRDGQHLTAAGYDYISPIIEEWIRSL